MLIALGVLLIALFAVVIKDWNFWFPPADDSDATAATLRKRTVAAPASEQPRAISDIPRDHKVSKSSATSVELPFRATAERAALPPLQVEVVAGNRRITIPPRSNAIHLDLGENSAKNAADANAVAASTGDHVQMSPQTNQNVSVSVAPDYPLLARQMKVQGAVILQALISRDGSIQELQVLSGPGILATAAREAVKQWRFKPYYMSGQPVETQARITVNFTISTN